MPSTSISTFGSSSRTDGSTEHSKLNPKVSDILPTGFECGVLNGQVKPGDTLAIVGAGPVGLAALLTSQFFSPSKIYVIDVDDKRLQVAKDLGATGAINNSAGDAAKQIMTETGGEGVNVAIEAVVRRQPSMSAKPSSEPAGVSPTSASTERQSRFKCRGCGTAIWPSRLAWWTPPRPRCC